jgi:putative ABC transport system ATP-binding protein
MSPTDDILLEAASLHKSYGKGRTRLEVLRGLDLQLRRGEFLAVMGPSGCGKSTLLHLLGLMALPDPQSQSRLLIDGRDVPQNDRGRNQLRRKRIGIVFQRFNLLGVLSAADNVNISLKVRGFRNRAPAEELFQAMGVDHLKDRKPGQMSIGEQQRVAVVRALAHRPDLLLADEPTGNLDSRNSEDLLGLFEKIHQDRGQTIVMITHSAEAASHADRIVHMKDGKLEDGL